MSLLTFETDTVGDAVVIAMAGELDVAGSAIVEQELERVRADIDPRAIVLDLSDLEFMDSTGLRLVVLADVKAREDGRHFALVRGNEEVHRVFEITRMTDRLTFLDSVDQVAGLGEEAA